MGKTREKPMTNERQILTDATGKPTHVVLTVEAFQDMEELIEDLQEFQEFSQTRDNERMIPWMMPASRMSAGTSPAPILIARTTASGCALLAPM